VSLVVSSNIITGVKNITGKRKSYVKLCNYEKIRETEGVKGAAYLKFGKLELWIPKSLLKYDRSAILWVKKWFFEKYLRKNL
jgi:hypothetical protein